MADVNTGTAPHYREILRRLLGRDQPIGMGYSSLGFAPAGDGSSRYELCIDATITVTDAEAQALRELIESGDLDG